MHNSNGIKYERIFSKRIKKHSQDVSHGGCCVSCHAISTAILQETHRKSCVKGGDSAPGNYSHWSYSPCCLKPREHLTQLKLRLRRTGCQYHHEAITEAESSRVERSHWGAVSDLPVPAAPVLNLCCLPGSTLSSVADETLWNIPPSTQHLAPRLLMGLQLASFRLLPVYFENFSNFVTGRATESWGRLTGQK